MSLFDPPWRAEHRALQSRLPPDECAARLEPRIASIFGYRTTLPVRGWAAPHGFRLTKAINHRNSFQPQARGTFEATGDGSRIHVKLGLSPVVIVFICIWCGVLASAILMVLAVGILTVLIGGIQAFRTEVGLMVLAGGVGIPAMMLAFGIALLAFGRWLARDEAGFLMRFLEDTLEAQGVPPTQI